MRRTDKDISHARIAMFYLPKLSGPRHRKLCNQTINIDLTGTVLTLTLQTEMIELYRKFLRRGTGTGASISTVR